MDIINYKRFDCSLLSEMKSIYQDSNWNTYLKDDEKLRRSIKHSLCLYGAFDKERLIGFIRCVGDGEHIVMVQDLIILSDYQKQGIGTTLFKYVWEKYNEVRMFHIVTDIEDELDNHFYQSFGMKKLEEGHMVSYFRVNA